MKHIAAAAHGEGLRVVVINNRGRGGVELRTAMSYCAAFTSDLRRTVALVKARCVFCVVMSCADPLVVLLARLQSCRVEVCL